MRRFWIRLVQGVTVMVLLVVLTALLATLVTARRGDPGLYPPKAGEPTVTVYLIHNWMHATLALPSAPLSHGAGATARALSGMAHEPWVSVGWGDHWYYQERGITPRRAADFARAMLKPGNPSVVALDPLPEPPSPETMGRRVLRLELSQRGFERLRRRLDAAFALEAGQPVRVGRGRSPDSWFFRSGEGSDLAHQCNHWIAELLNAAGVPVAPVIDTMTEGLSWDLRLRAEAVAVRGRPALPGGPETPPVYSGTFEPLSATSEAITGEVTFDAYRIRFGSGEEHATAPVRLAHASDAQTGERSLAALLRVPADSLVEIRRVERARLPAHASRRVCGGRPLEQVALGFRKPTDAPYEIALAAFAAGPASTTPLCGVFQYVQP